MRVKRVVSVLLLVVVLLNLPGCLGSREMDQVAYVTALGLDVGQANALEVTFVVANPVTGAGAAGSPGGDGGASGGAGGKTELITGVEAPSVDAAIDLVNAGLTRRVTLEQMKAVVISEKLARQGIGAVLPPLRRYPSFRDTAFVLINGGRTFEVLNKNHPFLETNPAKQFEMVLMNGRLTGQIPYVPLKSFLNALDSHAVSAIAAVAAVNPDTKKRAAGAQGGESSGPARDEPYLAGQVPRLDDNPFELMGTAVFRGDRLVGFVDGETTRVLLMLRGEFYHGIFILPDPRVPGRLVVLAVHQREKPSVKLTMDEGGFRVREKIALEYDLRAVQSGQHYECLAQSAVIDRALEDYVTKQAAALVQTAQRRWRADILRWGFHAAHTVPTWQEWEKLDWLALFPGATVDLTVSARMRRPGMLFDTGAELGERGKCFS